MSSYVLPFSVIVSTYSEDMRHGELFRYARVYFFLAEKEHLQDTGEIEDP